MASYLWYGWGSRGRRGRRSRPCRGKRKTGVVGQFVLREEPDFSAFYSQTIVFEVDYPLVRFEHVETEEKINISTLWSALGLV